MLSEAIRQRLEQLNRAPIAGAAEANDLIAAPPNSQHSTLNSQPSARPCPIQAGEVVANASGEHLRLAIPLVELWPRSPERIAAGLAGLRELVATAEPPPHPELAAFVDAFPRGALFLDLETCGFAGSAIFLVGLVRHAKEGLLVEQLLARNYAEERAVLESLWRVAVDCQVLVTFNGKSFDWPMVHDRSTRHRLGRDDRDRPTDHSDSAGCVVVPPKTSENPRPELVHFDLLHHARRRWRQKLPNCRLQTLEYYLCGRRRAGDIPGSQIPEAYHHFVRSGKKDEMRSILHHNVLDLVTLVELSLKLGESFAPSTHKIRPRP